MSLLSSSKSAGEKSVFRTGRRSSVSVHRRFLTIFKCVKLRLFFFFFFKKKPEKSKCSHTIRLFGVCESSRPVGAAQCEFV